MPHFTENYNRFNMSIKNWWQYQYNNERLFEACLRQRACIIEVAYLLNNLGNYIKHKLPTTSLISKQKYHLLTHYPFLSVFKVVYCVSFIYTNG